MSQIFRLPEKCPYLQPHRNYKKCGLSTKRNKTFVLNILINVHIYIPMKREMVINVK